MDLLHLPSRFALETEIGHGPEGRHYRALDRETGAPCRVTIAHGPEPQLALRRHYVAQARLAHPHVAAGLAEGPVAGGWYAVREWVGPIAEPDLAGVLARVPGWLKGLGRLHEAGLVHGAVRPAVLGEARGVAKLADAGRLWRIGQSVAAEAAGVAPEVAAGARVDGRTDLFLLGRALEALLGPAVALVAAPWAGLLERLTADAPRDRFASAAEALAWLGDAPAPAPARLVTPFVGRRAEMARLIEIADAVEAEEGVRTVAVVGEAGVGKTRLLEEFRTRLLRRDFAVVSARPGAERGPWSAWTPLLPALLDRVAAEAARPLLPVLAALMPALGVEAAPAIEPKAARIRLFRAIATLIEEAASAPGLALVLDDWHRADAESLALLEYLQRALPAVPVVFVLAGETPPDGAEAIELGRFGQGEVRALCRGLWDGRDPGGGAGLIEDATGGHPALVEEAVLECVGAIAAGQKPAHAIRAQLAQPRTHQAMWTARLAARTGAARCVAAAAAVAGAQAPMPLLASIAGLSEEVFLGAVEELADAGLLVADGDGHTMVAPAGEDLPDHHARALAYWQAAARLGAPVRPSLLAHHALRAGDAAAGPHYALLAAEEALKLFASEEADRMLDAAARCLAAMPEAPVAHRLALTAMRADHWRHLGQGVEAEAEYREAIVLAGACAPGRAAELTTSLGIALGLQARSEEAAECFQAVIADADTPAPFRCRATTALARLRLRTGLAAEAAALCHAALAEPALPSLYRGEALGMLGLLLTTAEPPRPGEGLAYLAEATAIAEETGDRLALTNALMLEGNARLATGQLPEARRCFERFELLAMELGLPDERVCAVLNLAQVAYEEGRYPEAFSRASAGALSAHASGNRIYEAFGRAYQGLAGCHLGRLTEAEAALHQAFTVACEARNGHLQIQVMLAQMEAALFLGRFGRVEELGLELESRQAASGVTEFAGAHALRMGELYELAGEVAAAMPYLQQARAHAEASGSATILAGVALVQGRAALRSGQLAVAQRRGLEALAAAEAAGAGTLRFRSLLLLARADHGMGFPEAGRAHLDAAEELASELGAPHWTALAWQLRGAIMEDGETLRQKAAAFLHFYTQQLPPLARQEFLNWPERKDLATARLAPPAPFAAELQLRIPQARPVSSDERRGGDAPCTPV